MKLFISAGEASGDLHAGNLAATLLQKRPDAEIIGFGGSHMVRAGVDVRFDLTSLAVVGLAEVISKLGSVRRAMKAAKDTIKEARPDAVILVDFPGFHLHLARFAHGLGIPVIYYIAPQVWAWHRSRVKKIAKYVDRLLVVFSFEVDFFAQHGINAFFVGHPLLDILDGVSKPEKEGDSTRIGLLPGSRQKEVEKLLPVMLESARIIAENDHNVSFEVSRASTVSQDQVSRIIKNSAVDVDVSEKSAHDVAAECDLVLVASGTATLESCIAGTPMVVLYKISPFSYMVIRTMIHVSSISLVNLIAGKKIVPELVQGDAVPGKIVECVFELIEGESMTAMRKELKSVRDKLGSSGASGRAADEVIRFVEAL